MSDLYAVTGNPIGHSKSPLIHGTFAEQTGQDIVYTALECPLGGFAALVDAFRERGGRGLNITAPFKLDAFAYCGELKERARFAGAVNAMSFDGERVTGENFDGIGLVNDIGRNLGVPLSGRRVLMLGAGGAARGAVPIFLEQGPSDFVLVNRTPGKAEALRDAFADVGTVRTGSYDDLRAGRLGAFDVVVNATSASLKGEALPIDEAVFNDSALAYELLYGKGLTPFLRVAQRAGVDRLADGVGMLVEQAAEAFAWWRGVRPDTAPLIRAMTVPLTESIFE